jgi:PelA/Pel-15E family pectate lyase
MVNVMNFIREVARDDRYSFVSADRRAEALKEFDRGIQCILKCQIAVNGKLTAWCAQHDAIDYSPRPARAFELVSLSGSESVGIVRLLMSLDHPDAATIAAIEGAVAWFESAKIKGRKLVEVDDEKSSDGMDRRLVEDPDAAPMWARFYEIGTNRPFFCDRDGIVKYQLSEIGYERRNNYSWLGVWPAKLLGNEYPQWKRKRQ